MPKDPTPPPPMSQYEGYRWLGAQWGRSGRPTPPTIGALLAFGAAGAVCYLTVFGDASDRTPAFIAATVAVGVLCLAAGGLFLAERHFASRARDEQRPFIPGD